MANDINKDNFSSEVLENDKLVLVDFWAEWCGPCKQISPRLEELANKYSENLTVCKVNVDENRELAIEYMGINYEHFGLNKAPDTKYIFPHEL